MSQWPIERCASDIGVNVMNILPKSEMQAKFSADRSEKRGEILTKHFADSHPLISRKRGRKKFHENCCTFPTRDETKFFHKRDSGSGGGQWMELCGSSLRPFSCHFWLSRWKCLLDLRFITCQEHVTRTGRYAGTLGPGSLTVSLEGKERTKQKEICKKSQADSILRLLFR